MCVAHTRPEEEERGSSFRGTGNKYVSAAAAAAPAVAATTGAPKKASM